jgi:hypothetical protein
VARFVGLARGDGGVEVQIADKGAR